MGGKVTCTLGEVKNRADFIIYWGGNPAECHPRHFSKYTITQKGKFIPQGRKGRTMVLVDIRETPSAKAADIFLQIKPGFLDSGAAPGKDTTWRDTAQLKPQTTTKEAVANQRHWKKFMKVVPYGRTGVKDTEAVAPPEVTPVSAAPVKNADGSTPR